MATIWMDPWEAGHVGPRTAGTGTLSTLNPPGAWRIYTLKVSATPDVHVWTSSVSEFYGQGRFYLPSTTGGILVDFISPNGTANLNLFLTAGTQLAIRRGTTVLGTGASVLVQDREYYVQFHFTINDTTGVVDLRLDGAVQLALTGQDTRNDAGANGDKCDRIDFNDDSGCDYFADWIINDTTGTANVSYPNNLGIEALMPTAAGDNTGLTPSAGSNWQNVDERPPNDVTDYNSHATNNIYDLYNIPSTQWTSVSAVALALRAAANDAGAKSVAHRVKADTNGDATADTEYTGSDLALSTTWAYFIKYYDQQPDSTNWTPAKVNALQPGAVART